MDNTNLIYFSLGLSGFLLLLVIWQTFRLHRLDKVRKEFFSSEMKKDLEQILIDQNRALTKLNQEQKIQNQSLDELYKLNQNNLQKIGFIRFNPFDDAGGNISFALAILDAHNDGVVISSLHGREGTRVYAKAIKNNISESKLTEEEMEVIKKAK